MKPQIVIIHGGHANDVHEDFINARLKNKAVTADTFKSKPDWRADIEKRLADNFEIFYPKMPNNERANYEEWKVWFERMSEFLNDWVIFIGHSLGGIFLAKYLSENIYSKKIKALFLIAAPYDGKNGKHIKNSNYYISGDLGNVEKQVKDIRIFHSKDDPVVPFDDMSQYLAKLPSAKAFVFENRGHFNEGTFPELIEALRGYIS